MRKLLTAMLLAGVLCGAGASETNGAALEQAVNYVEWLLGARFTPAERVRCQQAMGELQPETIANLAGAQAEVSALNPHDREAAWRNRSAAFRTALRSGADDSSRWMLSIAERNAPAPSPTNASLHGKWSNGRFSMIQYENRVTGAPAPPAGNHFSYEFRPDGTYQFHGLMQTVLYHCTTTLFSTEKGSYAIQGDRISVEPQSNVYKMTDSCAPSRNGEKPGKIVPKTYRFRIGTNEAGLRRLELIDDQQNVQNFQEQK